MRIYLDKRGGAHIHGSVPELALVAKAVSDLIEGTKQSTRITTDLSGSPAPYIGFLAMLQFEKTHGPILVTIKDRTVLHVAGGKENLATYASQFIFGGHAVPGDHHHPAFDYPPDYISVKSVPVVIEVESS